uniref:G-protein coupled receptors family 1 profile domain-containing protein n=1 Tax=Ditylenchus dipsaci TaxID=166011 RepID=A0A915CPN0_9BILA
MDYIYPVNTAICLILGIALNSTLIYFILKAAEKNKRKHSKVLLLTCSIDVIGLLVVTIIEPVFLTEEVII